MPALSDKRLVAGAGLKVWPGLVGYCETDEGVKQWLGVLIAEMSLLLSEQHRSTGQLAIQAGASTCRVSQAGGYTGQAPMPSSK